MLSFLKKVGNTKITIGIDKEIPVEVEEAQVPSIVRPKNSNEILKDAGFNLCTSTELKDHVFLGLKADGEKLDRLNFTNSKLKNSQLTKTSLVSCNFTNADLTGSNMQQCNLSGAFLDNSNLSHVEMAGANLENASIIKSESKSFNASWSNFYGANMKGMQVYVGSMLESDLRASYLGSAVMISVNFSKALMAKIEASNAKFLGCRFYMANLDGISFEGSNLSGSDFTRASLKNANLDNANLESASFIGANLTGATIKGAKFKNTIFDERGLSDLGLDIKTTSGIKMINSSELVSLYGKDINNIDMTALIHA